MRHRIQVYLGALQCLSIIAGAILASASFHHLEEMLYETDHLPLTPHRMIASCGGLLLILPILWIGLTIWADRQDLRFGSPAFVFISGLTLLVALIALFTWSCIWTASQPYRTVDQPSSVVPAEVVHLDQRGKPNKVRHRIPAMADSCSRELSGLPSCQAGICAL